MSGTGSPELILSPILITYASIVIMALIPIFIGSFMSVYQNLKDEKEIMSKHDAYMFPIIGSCVLFGIYMLFKYFSKEYVNLLLTAYFLLLGFISLAKTVTPLIKTILNVPSDAALLGQFTIPQIPYCIEKAILVKFGIYDIASWMISAATLTGYVATKHWILNNILGLCFSIQGVALLSLNNYNIGCILLGGLFFYDIFWVFGTDVMVTVAKSFDAPIKLLFPKNIFAAQFEFSMLGLGDIVIPGVFIALLLRYDAFRSTKGKEKVPKGDWPKPYFLTCFVAYTAGLITTIGVMHIFRAAQPALLYLCPACIGSSFLTAFYLGDITGLFSYSEETETQDGDTESHKNK